MKTAAVPVLPDPAAVALAAQVDELGAIGDRLAPLRALIAREEALRKTIRAAHEASPADREIEVLGTRYRAVLGPRGNQTAIDFPAVIKSIKAAAFAKFATCGIGTLAENVSPDLYSAVTSTDQTGPRSLKVYERPV
jgi:hypothetical protein